MASRILTTHVGSLIRPPKFVEVLRAMESDNKPPQEVYERALRESVEEIAGAVRMAAGGDTALSPQLASSMLDELRKLERPSDDENDRIITHRDEEGLQLIADGCSTPEVAAKLYISQKTVKNHLASIYQKLDARDRTQAVLQAVRMGIIHLD